MSINSGTRRQAKISKKREQDKRKAAELSLRRSVVQTIFLDESGNTGANLIDDQQPVFTMAGVSFSEKEALRLLKLIDSKSEKEVHFSSLKRKASGQDGVVRMLKHSLIKKANVKVCVINKPFMIVSKIVDLLIEDMAFKNGFDLYKDGLNIALSNTLFYCLPAFCGEDGVRLMQKQFIEMIKSRGSDSISAFYASVESLKAGCSDERFVDELDLILATKKYINGALASVDRTNLDPLVPTLFSQFVEWGSDYPVGFNVVHDDSKTLAAERQTFEDFMTKFNGESVELGYDRRKFKLPLKGRSLNFGSSQNYPQLQVADVVASAVSYWANRVASGDNEDEFFLKLDKLDLRRLIISNVWPSEDVTPESLGTVHSGGINAANGGADFLMRVKMSRSSA